VAGAVCTMLCGSVICPVPFPLCLITTHTSTAAAVVNNYDATRRDTIFAAIGYATDRHNRGDDGLVQQRISLLIALVVLGTKYLSATPL